MDRFGPAGKVSKKRVHLLRWSTFPGRTGWNFGWMDRAQRVYFHWPRRDAGRGECDLLKLCGILRPHTRDRHTDLFRSLILGKEAYSWNIFDANWTPWTPALRVNALVRHSLVLIRCYHVLFLPSLLSLCRCLVVQCLSSSMSLTSLAYRLYFFFLIVS